jgi:hypothetical protein
VLAATNLQQSLQQLPLGSMYKGLLPTFSAESLPWEKHDKCVGACLAGPALERYCAATSNLKGGSESDWVVSAKSRTIVSVAGVFELI